MNLLLDKNSARTVDAQGFLHVEGCNISKATVSPYYGREIPDYEARKLDPEKIYQILRTPEELEKAAATFNNLPLLDTHIEVSALDLMNPEVRKHQVGTTGEVAKYVAPYLRNSLAVWTAGAIAGIDSKEQTELSCAYRFDLDMTPGEFEGMPYDGRMLNIIGNHVALVEEGRAGHDVVVADAALVADSKATNMVSKLLALKGQITSELKPGVTGEAAECLDDLTGALDVAVHHLLDFEEKSYGVEPVAAPAAQSVEGSMTVEAAPDENPEGINQYTGGGGMGERKDAASKGTAAAKSASATANKTGKKEDHFKAYAAHKDAQMNHSLSSSPKEAGSHESMARYHLEAAGKAKDSCTVDIAEREGTTTKAGEEKYGEVKFADAKNKKYPIDTPERVKSACGFWDSRKNRNNYSKEEQATITQRINSAAKKFKIGQPAANQSTTADSKEALMGNAARKLTPRGHAVASVIASHISPKLAADKALQISEVLDIVKNLAPDKFSKQRKLVADAACKHFKDRLAKDEELDPAQMEEMLEELEEGEELEDAEIMVDDPGKALMELLGKLSIPEESLLQINELINKLGKPKEPAADETAEPKEAKVPEAITQPAMDAAISQSRKDAIAEVGARFTAGEEVFPIVGKIDVMAADSAAAIYKLALDHKGVKTEGVDPSAYRTLVSMIKVESTEHVTPRFAADKAAVDEFDAAFPEVKRVKSL